MELKAKLIIFMVD